MKKSIIIVESPVKTIKITQILNSLNFKNFQVIATGGHLSNLKEEDLYKTISLKDGKFKGNFQILPNKKRIIDRIKNSITKDTDVYICADDDREGEKIADDVVVLCKIKKYYRVVFTEITQKAINSSIVERHNIRLIDEQIVLAQWTRRMIDFIIGFGFSPLISYYFNKNNILEYLNKGKRENKVKPKGIGRIIAMALSILAERQKEIEIYNETEHLPTNIVVADYKYEDIPFRATGNGLEFKQNQATEMNHAISTAEYKIHRVYERTREIEEIPPYPAFTTPILYSACSYLLEMPSSTSKKIAQDLYENGFINYPRTDSINLSNEASEEIIAYLDKKFTGNDNDDILRTKRKYKKRNKFSQEAHEAIRPTIFKEKYEPENIKRLWKTLSETKNFTNSHFLMYRLIWYRAICTQLKNSEYDRSKVTIKAGDYSFIVRANERYKDGWEKHYGDFLKDTNKEADTSDWKSKRVVIPKNLIKGTILEDIKISSREKPKRAPSRISEGGLITMLTNLGVSRPSTLHTIVQSLVDKKYVEFQKTLLCPTDLGMEVYKVITTHLDWLSNVDDAREFESTIKEIEEGNITDAHGELMKYWDRVEEFKKIVYSK